MGTHHAHALSYHAPTASTTRAIPLRALLLLRALSCFDVVAVSGRVTTAGMMMR